MRYRIDILENEQPADTGERQIIDAENETQALAEYRDYLFAVGYENWETIALDVDTINWE